MIAGLETAMHNMPILETMICASSTYERRSEWSSHGYCYVTMHDAETHHGWGGYMHRDEWDRYTCKAARDVSPRASGSISSLTEGAAHDRAL